MAPATNIVILALAILRGPVPITKLAEKEELEEAEVRAIVERLQGKQAVVVADDEVEITKKGEEIAWEIVENSLP